MKQRNSSPAAAIPSVTEPTAISECLTNRFDPPPATRTSPHELEREVQIRLQSHPALKFSRLHVHQCPNGICLEGFLESNEDEIDLCDVVRSVHGVTSVINRIVITHPNLRVPKKG